MPSAQSQCASLRPSSYYAKAMTRVDSAFGMPSVTCTAQQQCNSSTRFATKESGSGSGP